MSLVKRLLLKISIISLANMVWLFTNGQTPYLPPNYSSGISVNYVRTWDALRPETNANNITTATAIQDFRMTTQYLDGLGRPIQTVIKQGSWPTGFPGKDMINAITYDEFGRETYKFLASPATSVGGNTSIDDGMFKLNPFEQQAYAYSSGFSLSPVAGQGENYFYSQTKFEPSPLNRVTETFAPGNNWAGTAGEALEGNRRSVKIKYYANTANDLVRIWNITNNATVGEWGTISTPSGNAGYYAAGELYKTITIDEHGKQIIEFKDKSGQVILKKVQLTASPDDGSGAGYAGWICTYYAYDDLGNLRIVLPPNCVNGIYSTWVVPQNNLDQLCFRYEYDERNRMIRKWVPGSFDHQYVYDARDRLVMSRDANQIQAGKWTVTKYDALNRSVETGIWTNGATFATHRASASASTSYPATPNNYEQLSLTYYDDYSALYGGMDNTFVGTWSSQFISSYNTAPLYAQPLTATTQTKGMVTWTATKVLGTTNHFIFRVMLYDDKGRVIQVKTTNNITTGSDVTTTQYNWAGQPLIVVEKVEEKNGSISAQNIVTVTRYTYDDLSRMIKLEKKISHSAINSGSFPATWTTILTQGYDAIGQLKQKTIGNKKDPSTGQYYSTRQPLEVLDYDYNIRGWQLGMNRSMAKGYAENNFFGYDIGYDVRAIGASGMTSIGDYTTQAYNGNIAGIVWRSAGDRQIRKYDYSYDAANRLMKADFLQKGSGTTWSNSEVNFNVKMGDGSNPTSAYDGNGNIQRMQQWGLKLTGSTQIDDLSYIYYGNRLKSVTESVAIGSTDHKLGDFTDKNRTGDDYGYDRSGNLVTDLNKGLNGLVEWPVGPTQGAITYNHLDLPVQLTVKNEQGNTKGTITYTYSADGVKLRKSVNELSVPVMHGSTSYTSDITTTTTYLNGFVFESKQYVNSTLNTALGYIDRLQFGGHEEGRIRAVTDPANPSILTGFEYDYMVKDHLGNVRMVLTEELKTDAYPVASMESAQAATENTFYSNLDATRVDKPSGYPTDTYTSPNDKVAKVRGDGNKIGPSMLLKVMAGDKFNIRANAWWTGTGSGSNTSPLSSIVSALISSAPGISGGKISATDLTTTILDPQVSSFLANQPVTSGKPKAYLNWILFDEQFKYVADGTSGAEAVGAGEEFKTFNKQGMPVNKNGYLYIYVSNETSYDVFFDNLQVTHIRGSLLEETHYYPFGLTMAGISRKALMFGTSENKRGYNGNELQNREFSDGSGLDFYDFNARMYDQQIGRFTQIDPLSNEGDQESMAPFHFGNNNPVRYSDPDGRCPCLVPVLWAIGKAAVAAYVAYKVVDANKENIQQLADNISATIRDRNLSTQTQGNNPPSDDKTFNGKHDTESKTQREALRKAKEENGIPMSQQPDRTIKPNTPEGDEAGLDNRNVKQYEYTNSEGKKVTIRQDKAANYNEGGQGDQKPHFNAGESGGKLKQHHYYEPPKTAPLTNQKPPWQFW